MAHVSPAEISASQIRSACYTTPRREHSNHDCIHYDLITFLETCQNLEIDFLPITWQPALDNLGVDARFKVLQPAVDLAMRFAFYRVESRREGKEIEDNEERIYRALVSHVSCLRHPEICAHPNIVSLIGICWDIQTLMPDDDHSTEFPQEPQLQIRPVLVIEKAKYGDLNCFVKSDGRNLNFVERIKLCADIAKGLRDLHKCRE